MSDNLLFSDYLCTKEERRISRESLFKKITRNKNWQYSVTKNDHGDIRKTEHIRLLSATTNNYKNVKHAPDDMKKCCEIKLWRNNWKIGLRRGSSKRQLSKQCVRRKTCSVSTDRADQNSLHSCFNVVWVHLSVTKSLSIQYTYTPTTFVSKLFLLFGYI